MVTLASSVRSTLKWLNTSVKQRRTTRYSRVTLIGLLFLLLALLSPPLWYPAYHERRDLSPIDHLVFDGAKTLTPFVVPSAFANAWVANRHLVVVGIPMRSDETCLDIHTYHAQSWGSFPEVARRANNFKGLMLPIYIAQVVSNTTPYWHSGVAERLNRDGNILMLRIPEATVTTNKTVGSMDAPDYGLAAMFTNARKVSLWFRYAYTHFRYTPFVAKADLDTYINVPAYLTILQQLPRVSTLYGKSRPVYAMQCVGGRAFFYLLGPLYTITRDVAREVFTERTVARAFAGPYRKQMDESFFRDRGFFNEDTIHSQAIFRRYHSTSASRVFPAEELADARKGASGLPPIAGLGRLYMEQIANPVHDAPTRGHVEGLSGYSYEYSLPGPLKRKHLIFVTDNCRCRDEAKVRPESDSIFLHRVRSEAQFQAQHEKYMSANTFMTMSHPSHLTVEDHEFFYHIPLSSLYCVYDGGFPKTNEIQVPACWRGPPLSQPEGITPM